MSAYPQRESDATPKPDQPHGGFFGDWSLHEGGGPGEFLLVPDMYKGFGYVRPNGDKIEIDRPCIVDGASVPRCFRVAQWLDPVGPMLKAALLHDYCWILRYTGENTIGFRESNRVMWEACKECGLKNWQRWLVWFAITVGGWWFWYKGTLRSKVVEASRCLDKGRAMAIRKGL